MTIRWPEKTLRPQNVAFTPMARTLAGPTSVSGKTQVVSSAAGIWKATFGSVIVKKRAEVLAWRAVETLLEGRLNPILVPFCRAYNPLATVDGLYDAVPHSDDSYFSDGSGYVGGAMQVLSGGMAANATSGNIAIGYGGTIEPGQHFSVGERGYRLRSVVYTSANTADITFRPPLREAVANGAELNFDDPVVRMRLATDDAMDLELALRRFGTPSVSFVEDI